MGKKMMVLVFSLLEFLFMVTLSLAGGDEDGVACRYAFKKGNFNEAIRLCTRAIESGDLSGRELSIIYSGRAAVWDSIKEYDQAIADSDKAIEIDPDLDIAYLNRSTAWIGKKEYDRAIADCDKAIKMSPNYADAYYNRGLAWWSKKEYDHALADYTNAIRISPDYVGIHDVYYSRGVLFFNQGSFIQASEDFKVSLKRNPQDSYKSLWLFIALERAGATGREELANREDNLNLSEWPGPVILFYLGKNSSEEVLKLAKNPDPKKQQENLCEAYFYLGQHFLIKGNKEQAINMFRLCLDTGINDFTEYNSAKEELKRLGIRK